MATIGLDRRERPRSSLRKACPLEGSVATTISAGLLGCQGWLAMQLIGTWFPLILALAASPLGLLAWWSCATVRETSARSALAAGALAWILSATWLAVALVHADLWSSSAGLGPSRLLTIIDDWTAIMTSAEVACLAALAALSWPLAACTFLCRMGLGSGVRWQLLPTICVGVSLAGALLLEPLCCRTVASTNGLGVFVVLVIPGEFSVRALALGLLMTPALILVLVVAPLTTSIHLRTLCPYCSIRRPNGGS